MSNLIDELAKKDALRSPQIMQAEKIRLRNVEVCKAKLPLFWAMLSQEIELLCTELRKAFPDNSGRHCSVVGDPVVGWFRIESDSPPPRRAIKVICNTDGLTIYYIKTIQKELWHKEIEEERGEIRITVRPDDESLVFYYHSQAYDSPHKLAEALIRHVIRE